ncbi:MAG: NAD(P)-dependent oxidoreductase [Burkholderiales bacterium]
MSDELKVGFIGLGRAGKPMARRILRAGFPLSVLDVNVEPVDELVAEGAYRASTPKEVAAMSDIVLTSLPHPKISEEVFLGPNGLFAGAKSGTILIETSTVPPGFVRDLATAGKAKSIKVIDVSISGAGNMPIAGGQYMAAAGKLVLMIGGDVETVERVRPVLQTFGESLLHMGDVGQGAIAKVVNNAMGQANFVSACEALTAGIKAGGDPKLLYQAISISSGQSWTFNIGMRDYIEGRRSGIMSTDLAYKDSDAILQLGRETGVPMLMHSAKLAFFEAARNAGYGDQSWIETMKIWEDMVGIRIGPGDQEN